MRELRELVLPHLVEARQRQSLYAAEAERPRSQQAQAQAQARGRSQSAATTPSRTNFYAHCALTAPARSLTSLADTAHARSLSPETTIPARSFYTSAGTTPTSCRSPSETTTPASSFFAASETSSPASPLSLIFTPRNHGRFPSAALSVPTSPIARTPPAASSPAVRGSLDGFGAPRPLTEVREEPAEPRDDASFTGEEHFEDDLLPASPTQYPTMPTHYHTMPHASPATPSHASAFIAYPADRGSWSRAGSADYPWSGTPGSPATRAASIDQPPLSAPAASADVIGPNPAAEAYLDAAAAHADGADLEWLDHFWDVDTFAVSEPKRRRGAPDSGIALKERIERISMLPRKWRSRKDASRSTLATMEKRHELAGSATASRASSMRERPSMSDLGSSGVLPTPNPSFLVESEPEDDADGSACEDDVDESLARTPLLPPVVGDKREASPVTSPLQSPKIVAAASLPSPALSTKPSIASFQHRSVTAAAEIPRQASVADLHRTTIAGDRGIVPAAEIPPISLLQSDEWSTKLGHANFFIQPEPWSPHPVTQDSYRALAADWDLARSRFARHLASTGEHYGASSKVYALTRQKWTAIEHAWARCHAAAGAQLPPAAPPASPQPPAPPPPDPATLAASLATAAALSRGAPPVSRALLAQHRCDVKFPSVALGDIVGPMARAPPRCEAMGSGAPPPEKTRKRAFWKFLHGILPESRGFGRREAVC